MTLLQVGKLVGVEQRTSVEVDINLELRAVATSREPIRCALKRHYGPVTAESIAPQVIESPTIPRVRLLKAGKDASQDALEVAARELYIVIRFRCEG